MGNATGLVLLLEDCPKNLLCTSTHILLTGFKPLLKFCYPPVTIFFSLESAVMMSGAGRREVASVKEAKVKVIG